MRHISMRHMIRRAVPVPGPRAAIPATSASTATVAFALALAICVAPAAGAQETAGRVDEAAIRAFMWPGTDPFLAEAELATALDAAGWQGAVSRSVMHDLEETLRVGPPLTPGPVPTVGDALNEMTVELANGRRVPLWVRLPSDWSPDRQWPLMFAMHGGPPGSVEGAVRSAARMISVWAGSAEAAGWIVASPAMVDVVSGDGRTADRLPYEIFQPEEAREVVEVVRRRFRVNPDRIVSTGISLGSNFSIAYAAAHPDWLSAIVPVSTEGDSREHLLRNVAPVPVYVLEGTQDQNIRGVNGPRSMSDILTSFGNDLVYREFGDRAHEGFSEHYADVLRWLDSRPRRTDPLEVLRVPHAGIATTSRAIHWIESGTRQGVVRARIVRGPARSSGASNASGGGGAEVHISTRWTGRLVLHLNDNLVDLDRPVRVVVNGVATEHRFERSILQALTTARDRGDERQVYPARLEIDVPTNASAVATAEAFWTELQPAHAEGTLSFWEMYAVRALEERFPSVGFDGVEIELPEGVEATAPEQVAVRVTSVEAGTGAANSGAAESGRFETGAASAGLREGDVLLRFGGEPFFRGRGAVDGLYHWLVRELRTHPQPYELVVWRDGARVVLEGAFQLGPYRN
jgi:hypothetical protein